MNTFDENLQDMLSGRKGAYQQIQEALKTLSDKEERVIRMRFGIGEKHNYTLEEVGRVMQLTRERIRQIESKALKKLQHPLKSKKLREFLS